MEENAWAAGQRVWEPAQRGWGGFPGRILKVDRVTPSGRAVIGPYQYSPQGRKIGGGYGDRIEPYAEKHGEALMLWKRRTEAEDMAAKIKWRSLTNEELDIAIPALKSLTTNKETQ